MGGANAREYSRSPVLNRQGGITHAHVKLALIYEIKREIPHIHFNMCGKTRISRVRNWYVGVCEKLLILFFRSAWTGEGERKNNSKFTNLNFLISDSAHLCTYLIPLFLTLANYRMAIQLVQNLPLK